MLFAVIGTEKLITGCNSAVQPRKIKKWKELPCKGARMETVDVIGLICAVVAVSIVVVIF